MKDMVSPAFPVLNPLICAVTKELSGYQQFELLQLGRQQSQDNQAGQDDSEWYSGLIEQEAGLWETLLLKQGHREGEVLHFIIL
ncbi:hypothetical protein JZ751_026050 [Albula glossodonta]|uniref:Uncharacterized protein n=1 Tax=Albula glossodonta TaxID=121402 RepID=A0A8T2ND11_9TELE|nr:hypothetical protein JZ751_026050 [Albula glossodonta]